MQKNVLALLFIIAALGMIFVDISPYFQGIYSRYAAWKQLKSENAALQGVLDEVSKLTEEKTKLQDTYLGFSESDREKLNKMLPTKPDLAGLLASLDALAQKNGVFLRAVNFNEKTGKKLESDRFTVLGIRLDLKCTYETFKNFLEDLERFIRITDVDALSFSTLGEAGESLRISLTAKTYIYQEQ